MKVRNILINGLLVAVTVLVMGCADFNTEHVSAYNKSFFDMQYSFDEAVIDLHDEVIHVEVKEWTDYEDGEQIQVIAIDGTVYLTSSYNCTLIKNKK